MISIHGLTERKDNKVDKDFFKGLLLFGAGFLTARYLMKRNELKGSTTTAGVNLDGIISNVKTWLKTNFPEQHLSDSEAEVFAKEATGIKTTGSSQQGSVTIEPVEQFPVNNATGGRVMRSPDFFDGTDNRGYDTFDNSIVSRVPDAWNMRAADGGSQPIMGKMQSDFSWSFN